MRTRGRAAGFTLVELMVAVTLFAVIMGGMAAIMTLAMRNQTSTIGGLVLQANVDMAGQVVRQTLSQASFVQTPIPPSTAGPPCANPPWGCPVSNPYLVAWTNTSPDVASGNPSINGGARAFTYLCTDATFSLYRFTGTIGAGALTMPAALTGGLCPNVAPGGTTITLVAGGGTAGSPLRVGIIAARPAGNDTLVEVDYTVGTTQSDTTDDPFCHPVGGAKLCISDQAFINLRGPMLN